MLAPAVRLLAREMGVDLAESESTARGTGILKWKTCRIRQIVMKAGQERAGDAGGSGFPPFRKIDFSRFW